MREGIADLLLIDIGHLLPEELIHPLTIHLLQAVLQTIIVIGSSPAPMEFECVTIARLIYDLRQEEIDELIKGILTPRDIMLTHDGRILVVLLLNI